MAAFPYDKVWIHRLMLRDHVRNEVYRQAISKAVKPRDVVLDVGSGTGILSVFAAKAGARKVYAVERTSMVEMIPRVAKRNGVQDRIEIIQGDVETLPVPERVDLIVSEWMGAYGVEENMLAPVLAARDRWLKLDGKMLPERVTAWMAPAWDSTLSEDMSFWRSRPHGVDLSPIAEETAEEPHYGRHHICGSELLAEPKELWTHDAYTCPIEAARLPFRASLSFSASKDGHLSALAGWFSATFGNGIVLTNAPDAPATHWGRIAFPLNRTVSVQQATLIKVKFTCEPAGPGCCRSGWSVRLQQGSWEHHGTQRRQEGPGA